MLLKSLLKAILPHIKWRIFCSFRQKRQSHQFVERKKEVFDIKTTGPDMDECIVKIIQNEFQNLKTFFSDGEEIPEEGECFIHDDYKYFEKLVGELLCFCVAVFFVLCWFFVVLVVVG